jgi:hypothetical protein
MNMTQISSLMIITSLLLAFTFPADGQAKRDSVARASVGFIQTRLGLTDYVTRKIMLAENNMISGLDSLAKIKKLRPDSGAKVVLRLRNQYLNIVKSLLTDAQWSQYQQLLSTTRGSFLKRMKGKKTVIKELEPGN